MTSNDFQPATVAVNRARIKPSLTTALVLGFGALILIGMVLVQGISMWSAQKNTRELLADNAQFAVLSLVRETRRRLAPVGELNKYVTRLIDAGQIDVDNRDSLGETLLTAMAGTDQVYGMAFVYPDGTSVRVRRGRGVLPAAAQAVSVENKRLFVEAESKYQPYWGKPLWIEPIKSTVISIRTPIWEGERLRGVLVSVVTVNALSKFIARSGALPLADNRFILFGRDHVLAHRLMEKGEFARQADIPLPRLDQVGDPVLAK